MLARALAQPLLESIGEGRSAVSRGKPLLQRTLCVNRQRVAVVFGCAPGKVTFRHAAAISMPELKDQRRSIGGLVGEVESSRVLGVGELWVRLGVLDDQLGDDDLNAALAVMHQVAIMGDDDDAAPLVVRADQFQCSSGLAA